MGDALITYLRDYPDMVERLVGYAFKENRNIKDLNDFKTALVNSWNTKAWTGITDNLNDDELMFLFNSNEFKDRIAKNISQEEYDKLYTEVERGEWETQRAIPKGKSIKAKQIKVVYTPKTIKIVSHIRAGKSVKSYNKGYSKWTGHQARFLSVRKAKKLPPKQIIADYNKHFKDMPRSSSSISTKLYRL